MTAPTRRSPTPTPSTNTGNVTLSGPFTITDVPLGTVTCSGDSLAPGATIPAASCDTKTYTTKQSDFDAGLTISDTATGHASFGATPVDSAPVTVNVTAVGQAPRPDRHQDPEPDHL